MEEEWEGNLIRIIYYPVVRKRERQHETYRQREKGRGDAKEMTGQRRGKTRQRGRQDSKGEALGRRVRGGKQEEPLSSRREYRKAEKGEERAREGANMERGMKIKKRRKQQKRLRNSSHVWVILHQPRSVQHTQRPENAVYTNGFCAGILTHLMIPQAGRHLFIYQCFFSLRKC